jgi:hypothetical protein
MLGMPLPNQPTNQPLTGLTMIGSCLYWSIGGTDERYAEASARESISKWLRNACKTMSDFRASICEIEQFFARPKPKPSATATATATATPTVTVESTV